MKDGTIADEELHLSPVQVWQLLKTEQASGGRQPRITTFTEIVVKYINLMRQ